jgi:hypothetical protein
MDRPRIDTDDPKCRYSSKLTLLCIRLEELLTLMDDPRITLLITESFDIEPHEETPKRLAVLPNLIQDRRLIPLPRCMKSRALKREPHLEMLRTEQLLAMSKKDIHDIASPDLKLPRSDTEDPNKALSRIET